MDEKADYQREDKDGSHHFDPLHKPFYALNVGSCPLATGTPSYGLRLSRKSYDKKVVCCRFTVIPDLIWTVQAVKYDSAKLTLPYEE